MTDTQLRERLAPLRAEQPTDAEIAVLLAAPRRRARKPRRTRLVAGLIAATAAAAVAFAALPGEPSRPASPAALLRAAAAVAADEPAPPAFAGYRYTEVLDRWHWAHSGSRLEQRVENWVDRNWKGRILAHPGTSTPPAPLDEFAKGGEREFEYGDGPLAHLRIAELPTQPRALKANLEAAYRDEPWAPGLPTEAQTRYDITRQVLLLLGTANTTPALRSALWGVLALMPGLRAVPDERGEAVMLPAPPGRGNFTVVFDVDTSEMLSWSLHGVGGGTPDQSHTFTRVAHVRNVGDRPGP